jgi:hypothetical protein
VVLGVTKAAHMSTLTLTDAFAAFGAKLRNVRWAMSAIAKDGALVISGWAHRLTRNATGERYEDRLSRWVSNKMRQRLLREHLTTAVERGLPVRLVVATLDDPSNDIPGDDGSKYPKTFSIRPDLVGAVDEFDGDHFVIEFRPNATRR